MGQRYFCPDLSRDDGCRLVGGELHHLVHVMRLGPGERIVVFNGEGTEAEAEIVAVSRSGAELRLGPRRHDPPEAGSEVVLASAPPKGDRLRWLVEKTTELGVSRLILLRTARTIVEPGLSRMERIRSTVIEACKQSGRNRLMPVDAPIEWRQFVETVVPGKTAYIADPAGAPIRLAMGSKDRARPVALAVGPEGGLTAAELELGLGSGASLVSLGPRLLRVETAALALAALFANR